METRVITIGNDTLLEVKEMQTRIMKQTDLEQRKAQLEKELLLVNELLDAFVPE